MKLPFSPYTLSHAYKGLLFLSLALLLLVSTVGSVFAQTNPGAVQDAEEARQKLLKAADQLDNIQANSEATRVSVESLKTELAQVQKDNAALHDENNNLKAQMTALQTAFNASETNRAKERQVLLDEVSKMIAASTPSKTSSKKKTGDKVPEKSSTASASSEPKPSINPPEPSSPSTSTPSATDDTPPAPVQHGYYHTVAAGETLSLIATAYRQQGIKVTIAEIQKANNLTASSVLKVGQKLFIPKPSN